MAHFKCYSNQHEQKESFYSLDPCPCSHNAVHVPIVCVFFFHPPLSLFRSLALTINTEVKAQKKFNSTLLVESLQLANQFLILLYIANVDLDERILLSKKRWNGSVQTIPKTITIQINNRFDLVSTLFKYVF